MRSFAIVPAAGQSVRMGQPKLLLPWRRGTVIGQVLSAWQASGVTDTVVVVSPDQGQLAEIVLASGAQLVTPLTPPPEMKVSVRHGLKWVADRYHPAGDDVWLLAPADMPDLSVLVIQQLLREHLPSAPSILVPVNGGRSGHPVLFPWSSAADVLALADHEGINVLTARGPTRRVPVDTATILEDLDTPDDYQRLRPLE